MTKILWTAKEAEQATQGQSTKDWQAGGVSIDTRTLKQGDLFVALKGDAGDGHDYVEAAFKAGAACALVRDDYVAGDPAWPLLRVKDTLAALRDLAAAARARTGAKVVGVTGSAGKTGTKDMLAAMLGACGSVHASSKSFNNHWGVPLTLANLPRDAAYAVIEMGMNHAGELTDLSSLVRPDVAIVTTVEPAHIEHFGTVEAIADAKAEIFTGMRQGGVAILNLDNPHYRRLRAAADKAGLKTVSFGEDEEADARLEDCVLRSDSSSAEAVIGGKKISYTLSTPGRHIVMNALAALAAAEAAGCDLARAAAGLKNAATPEGRGTRYAVVIAEGQPPVTVIDETYNANPASMRAAFTVLEMCEPQQEGRRIAVLGDMLELGPTGPALHAELANPLLKSKADLLFCCGAQMDALYQNLPEAWRGAHAKTSKDLAAAVAAAVKPGDVVLVKGSKGSQMGHIVQALLALHRRKDMRNAL